MKPTLVLLLVLCTTAAEYPREQKTDAEQHRAAHYRELDKWLEGKLANAPAERSRYWTQDFASPAAYERSIASYRRDWERMLGVPPPQSGPFREKRVAVGETAKLTIERVWIEAWPGVQAYGILITPKGAKRAPAVICLHGHGGSPELSAGIVTPSVYQDFARTLAEKGYVTFSPYIVERYSEENEPKQGPDAWGRDILHKKAHMLGMTLVGIEARKLMRVIDWLETLDTVDRSRIGMYGLSKGGQYTLAVAALDPRIRAAVISGWFNDRAKKNLTPGGPGASGMHFITHIHRSEYYFWNLLKQFSDAELGWLIAPRALLIENGDRDGAVLIDDARAEFARVEQVYRRLGLEQKAVFAGFSGGHQVDGRASYPFLDRWLGGKMNRRAFMGAAILTSAARAEESLWKRRRIEFRRYTDENPAAPIECVTPDDGAYIHTFFDVCPFSPSERYLAVLRLPFEDRKPVFGDTADVCVIDLVERTIQTVYRTRAFGMQTGAQVQWGKSDRYLYFNNLSDKHGGHAVCVQLDWQTGKSRMLDGPIYHVAPDESNAVSFNLDLINHVQDGYGCVVAPKNRLKLGAGASDKQGLWRTDIKTGKTALLVSMAQIFEALPDKDQYRGLAFYLFHTKYNARGSRIMQVVRARDPESEEGKYKKGILITMKPDGSDIQVAVPPELWAKGGHHPNWHPNGDEIFMNLRPEPGPMRFHLFRHDGSNLRKVSNRIEGSGHPAFEKTGRYIFTDAYPGEPVARKDGFVPMRLIDTREDKETTAAWMYTLGPNLAVLRLDPHPAWSRDGRKSCFNGAPGKRRQVFVANLSSLVQGKT